MNTTQDHTETNPAIELFRAHIGQSLEKTSLSPFGRWLAGTIKTVKRSEMAVEFTVRSEMINPAGTFHGGVMASIMDEVIGMTIFTLGKKNFFTSVNLVVDYFAPAKNEDRVTAIATVIKEGSSIINAQCEVWNTDKNKLLARGTSNLMKISTETSTIA